VPSPRRRILAWCLFDFANSPYTTLVVTFVYSTYFIKTFAPNEVLGTVWWSRAVAVAALVVALASPLLGAVADRRGLRVRFLGITTVVCVTATALLAFVRPGAPNAAMLALTLFVLADIGFELGMVFYNALLPGLAPPDRLGRISGNGWALGYLGGLLGLVIALVGFVQPATPWFGVSREAGFHIRATNLVVAAWLAAFSVPLFLWVRDAVLAPAARAAVPNAFAEVWRTFREVRRYRDAALFLVARLLFNDGLITIFAFGGIYAAGTFGMTIAQILVFGIVLNVAAGAGAYLGGYIDDRIGGKKTLIASCVALSLATALAVWAPTRSWLWVAGIFVGLFAGPNQAASRSLLARFAPPGRQTEFFGFFAFSGKFTAFLGPAVLGIATQAAGSQRAGVATVLVFFLVGGALMLGVDEKRGIERAVEDGRGR
jgi:MFS transporter, UMF1 family